MGDMKGVNMATRSPNFSVLPSTDSKEKKRNLNALLAKTIRKLRVQKGLSQEELAVLASVDRTYISGIERARRNITIATLERLIPHLSGSLFEFFKIFSQDIELAVREAENSGFFVPVDVTLAPGYSPSPTVRA